MVFAKLNYSNRFEEIHKSLAILLEEHFDRVESGLQGDSWIWVWAANRKVAVDTFSAMTYEVESDKPGRHVEEVIEVLNKKFSVEVYAEPELEAHE